ncbi:hypothetical protein ABFS82_06G077000 [Erythranthe guttata]
MKNTILSRLSSYPYDNDCNEVVADIPFPISSNLIGIGHDNSFCTYGGDRFLNHEFGVHENMKLAPPCEGETTLLDFSLQDHIFGTLSWDNNWVQQTNNEEELHLVGNSRKRSFETTDRNSSSASVSKKKPMLFQEHLPNIQTQKVAPVRRSSQKLTHKITALQKLVSPYGKTDTASVLLEASISIKALQHQIQRGEKRSNLQSRGLCLVPAVILKQLE